MKNREFDRWCDIAASYIKFKPDRQSVTDELYAHMEDKYDALIAKGYDIRSAERETIAAMGDPVEVGKALNSVHKPWLGRLWVATKVVLVLVLVAFAFNILSGGVGDFFGHYPLRLREFFCEDGFTRIKYDESAQNLDYIRDSVSIGDYTVTVTDAVICKDNALSLTDEDTLIVTVKVKAAYPWSVPPLFMSQLSLRDDNGNVIEMNRLYVDETGIYMNYGIKIATFDNKGNINSFSLPNEQLLNQFRYWNTWQFVIFASGVESAHQYELYYPLCDEFSVTLYNKGVTA
jgi:hypothetical protein